MSSPTPSFAESLVAADAQFWPAVARAATRAAQGSNAADLRALDVIVPSWAHAPLVRAALRTQLRDAGHAAFVPPRIYTPAAWAGETNDVTLARRVELFDALRANAWVRQAFGAQPPALWALARQIAALCDELTYAAVDDAIAFDAQLRSSLARHFRRRAARAVEPAAQLVLQLWRADYAHGGDGSVAATRLAALRARSLRAERPVLYVAAQPVPRWIRAWLEGLASRVPVELITADTAATVRTRPLLAAAWPELAGGETAPIAARADALAAGKVSLAAPLSIACAPSLEAEAFTVAQQVLDWRRAGVDSIALVALDRLTARRVRALLERAQVTVRDETGWKLSTTSAAAAVMRWYDVVADDLYWRALLDWLKSSFTLADRPRKAHEVALIERAIRAHGALRGAHAVRRALADRAADRDAPGARDVLALIETQAGIARRAGPTLGAHARALHGALAALGMRAALAADPVGAAVLRELDGLQAQLAGVGARASVAEFRALVAQRFEEASFVDADVDSPVVMVSLAATALRPFGAALLIGADARHLPSVPSEWLFMPNAVRGELGLPTVDSALHEQAALLGALLASTPRVAATWRAQQGDEPNSLSPLLERLQFVARRALGDDLARHVAPASVDVEARPLQRPGPRAAPLMAALRPARISASQAQSLVNCAYQFYARRLLGLAALDDVIEMPDKRDFGEALHEVLRRFHREWGDADFSGHDPASLAASLREHARNVFGARRTPGMLAFERRFDGLVEGYVGWLRDDAKVGWRFAGGEEGYRQTIALRDRRTVELVGRVDRIDHHADGRTRVLDYKARRPEDLRKALQSPGEDIQLPFYGLLLDRMPEAAAYLSFDRVREGDRGVHDVTPKQDFADLMDRVAGRLTSDLQRIADNAPLPALGAAAVCVFCEMRGLCRRDYWEEDEAEDGPNAEGAA